MYLNIVALSFRFALKSDRIFKNILNKLVDFVLQYLLKVRIYKYWWNMDFYCVFLWFLKTNDEKYNPFFIDVAWWFPSKRSIFENRLFLLNRTWPDFHFYTNWKLKGPIFQKYLWFWSTFFSVLISHLEHRVISMSNYYKFI